MASPCVSIILPTYNRVALLPRAIDSVLDQSYRDLELIVVDDCSTDGTEQELLKITDPRLRLIRQKVNSGPSAARNAGIRASTGQYIAFQDSDDEWLPGKIEKQISLLEQRDVSGSYPAACYSRFIVSHRSKQTIVPSDPQDNLSGHIYKRLLYENTMGTPTTIYRKDILDLLGYFDESLANREDWDLALRVSRDYTIAFLDEVTLISYSSPGSVNKLVSPESLITILNKHYDSYRAFPESMAHITWSIGSEYAVRRQKVQALRYMNISIQQSSTPARRLIFTALRSGLNFYAALRYARSVLRP